MTPPRMLGVLAATALAAGCAGARAPRGACPDGVAAIEIEGARSVKPDQLRARLATRAPGEAPWSRCEPFDPIRWDSDLHRIERTYQTLGFYSARVVSWDARRTREGIRLHVVVREGEPTRIVSVVVSGLAALPPDVARDERSAVTVRVGAPFREAEWERTKAELVRRLRERGHARAEVEADAEVDVEARAARLRLDVRPGERFTFGDVLLAPGVPANVPEPAIRAQIHQSVHPGVPATPRALADARSRLFQMGIFSAVAIRLGEPAPGEAVLPVLVDVRLAPTRVLRVGPGITLQPGRNDVHVRGEWLDRAFLGGYRSLRLRGSAGWAFVPNFPATLGRAEPGRRSDPIASFDADLQLPLVSVERDLAAYARAGLELGTAPAYRSFAIRPEAGISWRPAMALRLTLGAAAERDDLFDPVAGAVPVLGCTGACFAPMLTQSAEWDGRDDDAAPSRGVYARLDLREGLGSDASGLVQAMLDVRGYVPVVSRERVVLAMRAAAGTLAGRGTDTPIVLRLSSGGMRMRGYGPDRLSPVVVVPRSDGAPVAVPVGGNGRVELSAEARFAIPWNLGLVAFADAGAVTTNPLRPAILRELTVAVGLGLRYRTGFGPIRLDLAYRPPVGPALPQYPAAGATLATPRSSGCFGLGGGRSGAGAPESACAVHIWIGEAF